VQLKQRWQKFMRCVGFFDESDLSFYNETKEDYSAKDMRKS